MSGTDAVVEIYFRMRRDEFPDLYDNLTAVPKGLARATRLKVLAIRGFDAELRPSAKGARSAARFVCDPPESTGAGDPLDDLLSGRTAD